jgi:hypothetical protein
MPECLRPISFCGLINSAGDFRMKRSRRVVLTMMGAAAVGSISMGFVRRNDCRPDLVRPGYPGDGRLNGNCPVAYGGFGTTTRRFQWPGGGG